MSWRLLRLRVRSLWRLRLGLDIILLWLKGGSDSVSYVKESGAFGHKFKVRITSACLHFLAPICQFIARLHMHHK